MTHRQMAREWARGLDELVERCGPCFCQGRTRERFHAYLVALLGPLQRKNGWQIAEHAGDASPDPMQRFLRNMVWDAHALRDELLAYVLENLGDPDGVWIVDETGFLKKGDKSAGVQRQYSGTAGRIENCQIGVALAYASPKGCAFVDRELYLPESWTRNRARCQEAGIADEVAFATKPELACLMLERAFQAGAKAAWVTADEVYGQNPHFRQWLEAHSQAYVLAVPRTTPVRLAGQRAPEASTAEALAGLLDEGAWQVLSAGNGTKGPRWYDWVRIPLAGAAEKAGQPWLLVRRSRDAKREVAFYLVNAPIDASLAEFVRVAGQRWTIEVAFEAAKQEVGLDHYEVRSWEGWYRHITLAMLAHAFLAVTRRRLHCAAQEKGDNRLIASARRRCRRSAASYPDWSGHAERARRTSGIGTTGGADTWPGLNAAITDGGFTVGAETPLIAGRLESLSRWRERLGEGGYAANTD